MSDESDPFEDFGKEPPTAGQASQPRAFAEPKTEANWGLRLVVIAIVLVGLALVYVWGVTVMPRWWAHRVGKKVDGSTTAGAFYGLFIGFVFTLGPLVVLRQAFRKVPNPARLALLVISVALAAPNLFTLGIVLGNGSAAHAGDRTMDVNAPGFRAGSAVGAVLAVVAAVALFAGLWKWRRDRQHLKTLKSERAQQQARPKDDG